jgi:hypothetical protein
MIIESDSDFLYRTTKVPDIQLGGIVLGRVLLMVCTVVSNVLLVLPNLIILWVQHLARIALILVFAVVVVALVVFGMRMDSGKALAVATA